MHSPQDVENNENPFATKFWASGAIPFRFTEHHDNLDVLLRRIQHQRHCQIIGPHGSGKSTLLLTLWKQCNKEGNSAQLFFFNDQRRRLPDVLHFQKGQILFADGFEQLRIRDRLRLIHHTQRLIVTVHRPVWFVPILYRTVPQFSVFVQIVRQQISDILTESELRAVFERSGGNFRSAFFELYDQWEKRYNETATLRFTHTT